MKAKMFVGLMLAAVLGSCPIVAALSAASGPRGGHSCCRPDKAEKNQPSNKAAGGDCCLRVPASASAAVVVPEFHVVSVFPPSSPELSLARRLFSAESSGSSPPGTAACVRASSPRAPPAVPA